jgi:5-methylcytosine-specific restriction endonuclease McrA
MGYADHQIQFRVPAGTWARIRKEVMARDQMTCQGASCHRVLDYGQVTIDHKIPLSMGGAPLELANLQVLCRSCHEAKSAKESRTHNRGIARSWLRRAAGSTSGPRGNRTPNAPL